MKGKYTLIKHFWISCAHSVPGAGKCERVHGHNYKITFCLVGSNLNEHQMLVDFREIKHSIEKKFDHNYLNDFPEFQHVAPSTEKFAEVIFKSINTICDKKENQPIVQWVEVQETNEAFARYELVTQ